MISKVVTEEKDRYSDELLTIKRYYEVTLIILRFNIHFQLRILKICAMTTRQKIINEQGIAFRIFPV